MSLAEFRVLLVEDDAELAAMVAEFLQPHGFDVALESRGDIAVRRIVEEAPDAVVLDVNLPGMDGFSICRAVRPHYQGLILILTARGDEVDEVVGLELGADDYMSKPVRPRTLLARLRAHLRRSSLVQDETPSRHEIGALLIDASRRMVELNGETVDLTTTEFDLLWLLAENAGQVLSRNDIYQQLHGIKYDGLDRSIDLCISRLRKKIGDDPNHPKRIKSVRAVGYLLAAEK